MQRGAIITALAFGNAKGGSGARRGMRTREAQCSCCYTAGSDGWFSVQFFPGAVEHTGMQRPIRHAPPRVPAGCISLRAGLLLAVGPLETVSPSGPDFSLPRAQRGGVAERRAAGCGLSPRPRPDRRVSRPAAGVLPAGHTASRPARGEGGVRWRKGQPGGGRRWWGGHGKSGFIFPILFPDSEVHV